MSMNLKEEGRYVVNRGEDLMVIDFDGDVSLAEKLVRHRACATEWMAADWKRLRQQQEGAAGRGRSGWPEIKSDHDQAERWGAPPLLLEYYSRRREVAMSGEGLRISCGRRRSRSGRRWRLRRLLAESATTTPTTSGDERGRAGGRQIRERDHETTVSWFADLGRGVKDDGSKCCDWLRWEAAAAGWRRLRGWSPWSLDLRGLPSVEEKSGQLPSKQMKQRMSGRVAVDNPWVSAVSQRGCPRTNGDRSCRLTANKKERTLNWAWLRLRRLDRALRAQGLKGTTYRFLLGDLKGGELLQPHAPIPRHCSPHRFFPPSSYQRMFSAASRSMSSLIHPILEAY
ncbi:hypothetical protein BHM03_00008996 [Ensete ventricosum]|nr:hypothetical protein BHM03_00008996 [Ensete ventricosum]